MIRIVAIEREYGSGAAAISKAVADELGFELWDREIGNEIARRLRCDVRDVERLEDRRDPVFHRLLKAFMRGSFEPRLPLANLEMLDSERLSQLFEGVITSIARKGNCVIVGRGAPWFLREREDTYSVFLYAPYREKIRRTLAQGKTEAEAEELIQDVDRERAAFVKQYYQKDWPDRTLYNMLLNTKVGDAVAVRMILDAIEMLNIRGRSVAAPEHAASK